MVISVCPVAAVCDSRANPGVVVRGMTYGGNEGIHLTVCGFPNGLFDFYIDDGNVAGITLPILESIEYSENYSVVSPGHYLIAFGDKDYVRINFNTPSSTTAKFYAFKLADHETGSIRSGNVHIPVMVYATVPTPTTAPTSPTPTPTPSYGNLIIESDPEAATVYLDNEIKGITPLTIEKIPNGDYKILLRLDGYEDGKDNNVDIDGDTVTVDLTLSPKGTPTETPTTEPTPDYNETIAAIQSQIAEQNESLGAHESLISGINESVGVQETAMAEQQSTIVGLKSRVEAVETKNIEQDTEINWLTVTVDQILSFLGL